MPSDESKIFEKLPNPQQPKPQPEKTGDTVAMLVVVLLLIAIVANSPNKTPNNNDATTDTATMIDSTATQQPSPDTVQVEHYASPFDSIFDKMFNFKQYQ